MRRVYRELTVLRNRQPHHRFSQAREMSAARVRSTATVAWDRRQENLLRAQHFFPKVTSRSPHFEHAVLSVRRIGETGDISPTPLCSISRRIAVLARSML